MDIKFIEQSHEIIGFYGEYPIDVDETPVAHIADVARTCYQSERRKLPGWDSPYSDTRIDAARDADEMLVKSLVNSGHHAMLEHSYLSVRFITDRAIANEIVRHRHFSYAQRSTRYVNATKKGFEFVMPIEVGEEVSRDIEVACSIAATAYEHLIADGVKPEIARAVLPLCTATEIVVSGNFRAWRWMLQLRTAKDAHPQIRALMTPLIEELKQLIPVVFDDINPEG